MTRRILLTLAVSTIGLPGIILSQGEDTAALPALTVEAQVCTGIEERMPVGAADSFSVDVQKVYLWCKVTGATDTTFVKHVWSYEGKEMAVVELAVRSTAWRTWSYKTIRPDWIGSWEVKVLDADGEVLKAVVFTVGVGEPTQSDTTAQPADTDEPVDTGETKQP